ncbi:MAG: Hpt domain-containing protein [Parvularculaceae bacterium]|nr:Hpt domain-containing protein [Parvularculaceae bacterium]
MDRTMMTSAIDMAHLDLYVCGDRALLEEILTIFEEQAAMWVARLEPALPDEPWRNAAHALKGASRGVGAWAIGDLCEHAESLVGGVANKLGARKTFLNELKACLEEAVEDAQRIRRAA